KGQTPPGSDPYRPWPRECPRRGLSLLRTLTSDGHDLERLVTAAVDDRHEAIRALQTHRQRASDSAVVESAARGLSVAGRTGGHVRDAAEIRRPEVDRRRLA